MRLRPATARDVSGVAALERGAFGADAWSHDVLREQLTGSRRTAVVAQDEREVGVVGYAVGAVAGDVADLERIAVAGSHRRRGLARAMLDVLLQELRRQGAERVLLEVGAGNDGARAFYKAAGFAELDRRRRYYRDGSDAVVMSRELAEVRHG